MTIGVADSPTPALQLPSNAKVRRHQLLRKTPSLILSARLGPLLIALDMEGEVYSCGSATVGHETPLADLSHDSLQVCRCKLSLQCSLFTWLTSLAGAAAGAARRCRHVCHAVSDVGHEPSAAAAAGHASPQAHHVDYVARISHTQSRSFCRFSHANYRLRTW